jgi:hypothetical protein
MRDRARRGLRIARENPLGLAVAGAAVGFLAGVAVPSTRIEDERLGPAADQVKEAAREAGHEVVERGKSAAQTAGSVMETGRGSGTGDSGY